MNFIRIETGQEVTKEQMISEAKSRGWVFSDISKNEYLISAGYAILIDTGIPYYDEYNESLSYTINHNEETGDYTKVYTITELSPEDKVNKLIALKTQKKNEIAEARYNEEISGITINGIFFKTDDRSKIMIGNAVTAVTLNPDFTTKWKAGSDNSNEFIVIGKDIIIAAASAVIEHVSNCFKREGAITALIDNATTAEEVLSIHWDIELPEEEE